MSSGTQVDLDWAGTDMGNGAATGASGGAMQAGAAGSGYLSDEDFLGMVPFGSAAPSQHAVILSHAKNPSSIAHDGDDATTKRDSSGKVGPHFAESGQREQNDTTQGDAPAQAGQAERAEQRSLGQMPDWMAALAGDPKAGPEAQQLWREHQEFRAAFSSAAEARAVADEARAIKELLPGGVRDVVSLREATASVERIDAALFSGDARAQSEVVAELARANPAAFRSLFAEAARVLSGMGAGGREAQSYGGQVVNGFDATPTLHLSSGQALRKNGEGWGTQNPERQPAPSTQPESAAGNHQSPVTSHQSQPTSQAAPQFDPAAYASFERATNDAVARDVRGTIRETLARVLPEDVAEGAARRIGDDIFNDVHRALAADRALSEQVAAVLRDRRFGEAEQQSVAALLAGRAKQLVPSVARRVIGEWTGSVLNTARRKAERQAAAASRVDIAAPGGSLDSMPLRAMSPREVNYAAMSDEQILGM